MKKLMICLVAACLAFSAAAQPKALGIRIGGCADIYYQHYAAGNDFIECDLGFQYLGEGTLLAKAIYDFSFYQPDWTTKGSWNLYAGPGVSLGSSFTKTSAFKFGVVAQVGIEYTFWFPLQLSVDVRPSFGIKCGDNGIKYDVYGLYGFVPAISVRYSF